MLTQYQQHLGENVVRTIAMDGEIYRTKATADSADSCSIAGTEGLVRGAKATDTGSPIMVPVGPGTLGRIMNVTGDPIDERGPIKAVKRNPIHADPPDFVDQSTSAEVLVTGIKVVDLLAPYARGGKIGLFGGAGVGKTVFIQELIVRGIDLGLYVTMTRTLILGAEQYCQSPRWLLSFHWCWRAYP